MKPDLIIGSEENPYMKRWHLIPRNSWFNVYLHKICRSDDDRALHDHRADNLSIILKGKYTEILGDPLGVPKETYDRKRGDVIYRKAEQPHRLIVPSDHESKPIPVWTLWIKFPDRRDWGFWVNKEWIQWEEYGEIYNEKIY